MQRTEDGGVIISCDFCGTDWDPQTGLPPMTEGHHGSVLCLECLKVALEKAAPQAANYACTLCLLTDIPATKAAYRGIYSKNGAPPAIVCLDCIHQAAKAFSRDPDIDWKWKK